MEPMALDPRHVVTKVAAEARQPRGPRHQPPVLLQHPPAAHPPLSSIQQGEEVSRIHREWARVSAGPSPATTAEAPGPVQTGGVRAKVRARVATAAAEAAMPAQQEDRALIGDLIRATDALARRLDDVTARVVSLEALVEEVVTVLGSELTHIRAALAVPEPGGEQPDDASS